MSATIYEFPVRGRFIAGSQREEMKSATNLLSSRASKTVIGGSWYHEEAIEAERTTKSWIPKN